jgi:elongator complex protein 3
VGLVIETRPDMVTCKSLLLMRRLGCTKIQMGVQSLDDEVLRANRRGVTVERIAQAFALARLFGFKTHAHFMANLFSATPEGDVRGYERLVGDARFMPDEVKMYPCALIGSAALMERYRNGTWRPYGEQTLVDVLVRNVIATPSWTRISRMIRDFSSDDIVDGNKKVNLREVVEAEAAQRALTTGRPLREIRHREINARRAEKGELMMEELLYHTSTGQEIFLQWVTPDGAIAGFLRLSLPDAAVWNHAGDHATSGTPKQPAAHMNETQRLPEETQHPSADVATPFADASAQLPIAPGEAMIREVHVYGAVAGIHQEGQAAQHRGLGKRLVERACEIAHDVGYDCINVISAIGTREYYRKLGFAAAHNGLYQQKAL